MRLIHPIKEQHMTDKELIQQSLDVLKTLREVPSDDVWLDSWNDLIDSLQSRLNEAEQGPKAWCRLEYDADGNSSAVNLSFTEHFYCSVPLYLQHNFTKDKA